MLRLSWRWKNKMSRKPRLVTKATLAPLRSRIALVATVDPWTRSLTRLGSIPAERSESKAPISGLPGVLGTFTTSTRLPSTATRSVKVPPTSIPTRIQGLSIVNLTNGTRGRFYLQQDYSRQNRHESESVFPGRKVARDSGSSLDEVKGSDDKNFAESPSLPPHTVSIASRRRPRIIVSGRALFGLVPSGPGYTT